MDFDDMLNRMDDYERERKKRNLQAFQEAFDSQMPQGQKFEDLAGDMFGGKKKKPENDEVTENDVKVTQLTRILTVGGPFDKKSHHINPDKEKNFVRIDLSMTEHCLYKRVGRNDRGEGVYQYVRNNFNEE